MRVLRCVFGLISLGCPPRVGGLGCGWHTFLMFSWLVGLCFSHPLPQSVKSTGRLGDVAASSLPSTGDAASGHLTATDGKRQPAPAAMALTSVSWLRGSTLNAGFIPHSPVTMARPGLGGGRLDAESSRQARSRGPRLTTPMTVVSLPLCSPGLPPEKGAAVGTRSQTPRDHCRPLGPGSDKAPGGPFPQKALLHAHPQPSPAALITWA